MLATLKVVQRTYPGRGISIEIGGPHPGLSDLLRASARVNDAELAVLTDATRFGRPELYPPRGEILYRWGQTRQDPREI